MKDTKTETSEIPKNSESKIEGLSAQSRLSMQGIGSTVSHPVLEEYDSNADASLQNEELTTKLDPDLNETPDITPKTDSNTLPEHLRSPVGMGEKGGVNKIESEKTERKLFGLEDNKPKPGDLDWIPSSYERGS